MTALSDLRKIARGKAKECGYRGLFAEHYRAGFVAGFRGEVPIAAGIPGRDGRSDAMRFLCTDEGAELFARFA